MKKEITLNQKDQAILDFIRGQDKPVGPTQIGIFYGQPYRSASAYCTLSLKKLVDAGRITRFGGKYQLTKSDNLNEE